jgi:hypothetical protein
MKTDQKIFTECRSHPSKAKGRRRTGCAALTVMLCDSGDCPFFKTNEEYDLQIRRLWAAGKRPMTGEEYMSYTRGR